MLFVEVAGTTNTVLELNPSALLHDVSRLMRCCVEIGWAGESDLVAGRIRLGTNVGGCIGCSAAHVGLDLPDVVMAESRCD